MMLRVVDRRSVLVAGISAAGIVLSGCAGTEKTPAAVAPTSGGQVTPSYSSEIIETPPEVIAELSPTTPTESSTGYSKYEDGVAVVATLLAGNQNIDVFADETTKSVSQTIERTTTNEIVFVAQGSTPDRLFVHLPTRPNKSMGWINKSDVELRSNFYSIEIKLSNFQLSVFEKGKKIHENKIGIGKDEVPTPDGFYYTIYNAKPKSANSVYGNFVIGLSGFSDVLQTFGTGIGRLGLHGTNRPDLVGTKASNGCIRMNNTDIDFLVARMPLGTPVTVIP